MVFKPEELVDEALMMVPQSVIAMLAVAILDKDNSDDAIADRVMDQVRCRFTEGIIKKVEEFYKTGILG